MLDDPAVFLAGAWEIPGNILQGDDGNVETIAEADEPGGLDGRVDVEAACQHHRLVGDDAHCLAVQPGESHKDVQGEMFLDLEEIAVIDD